MITIINPTSNLPDGALINGVANFYRATKPLTRVDGSALAIGDRWINPSTGVEGFWNGTYWLGTLQGLSGITRINGSTSSATYIAFSQSFNIVPAKKFLIQKVGFACSGSDATSNYTIRIRLDNVMVVQNFLGVQIDEFNSFLDTYLVTTNNARRQRFIDTNIYVDAETPAVIGLGGNCSLAIDFKLVGGIAHNFTANAWIQYREVL
jgi:hypothetical protein